MNISTELENCLSAVKSSHETLVKTLSALNLLDDHYKSVIREISKIPDLTSAIESSKQTLSKMSVNIDTSAYSELKTCIDNHSDLLGNFQHDLDSYQQASKKLDSLIHASNSQVKESHQRIRTSLEEISSTSAKIIQDVSLIHSASAGISKMNASIGEVMTQVQEVCETSAGLLTEIHTFSASDTISDVRDKACEIETSIQSIGTLIEETQKRVPEAVKEITGSLEDIRGTASSFSKYLGRIDSLIKETQEQANNWDTASAELRDFIEKTEQVRITLDSFHAVLETKNLQRLFKIAQEINHQVTEMKPLLKKHELLNLQNERKLDEINHLINEKDTLQRENLRKHEQKLCDLNILLGMISKHVDDANKGWLQSAEQTKTIRDSLQEIPLRRYGTRFAWILAIQIIQVFALGVYMFFTRFY